MTQCIFLLTLIIAWSYNDGNFHSLWHLLGLCDSAFWYIFPLSSNMFLFYPDAWCVHNQFFSCFEVKYTLHGITEVVPVFAGHSLLLFSVAKQLFIHIWEVIKDGPSFQLEYSIILRQLLNVKEYRYQMKPRIYSSEFCYQRCCIIIL